MGALTPDLMRALALICEAEGEWVHMSEIWDAVPSRYYHEAIVLGLTLAQAGLVEERSCPLNGLYWRAP